MSVPTLTPVSEWPTRKLPQATFDMGVRTAMNQMSTMVGELNSGVIPGINAAATGIVTSAKTAAAQSAVAVTKATEAAASATQAKKLGNNRSNQCRQCEKFRNNCCGCGNGG